MLGLLAAPMRMAARAVERMLGLERAAAELRRMHLMAARMLALAPTLPFHVAVATSRIALNSGNGVFLRGAGVRSGTVLCLYPGMEIPALPHAAVPLDGSLDPCMPMRAHPAERHNYVLNMDTGGTLDGTDGAPMAAHSPHAQQQNPFAVGHLVNHCSASAPNVVVASFEWRHALSPAPSGVAAPSSAPSSASSSNSDPPAAASEVGNPVAAPDASRFHIPNAHVSGFWFVCPSSGERVQLPPRPATEAEAIAAGVRGVAVIASRDIACGDELLLDYKLSGPPYPAWAQGWYVPYLGAE